MGGWFRFLFASGDKGQGFRFYVLVVVIVSSFGWLVALLVVEWLTVSLPLLILTWVVIEIYCSVSRSP